MRSRDSAVFGHHVGSATGPKGTRHFIAFDLSGLTPAGRNPRRAVLEVAVVGLENRPARLQLLADDAESYGTYGVAGHAAVPRAALQLPLTPCALDDLERAAGGFYSLTLDHCADPDLTAHPVLRVRRAGANKVSSLSRAA
jgi:hypothetical protein